MHNLGLNELITSSVGNTTSQFSGAAQAVCRHLAVPNSYITISAEQASQLQSRYLALSFGEAITQLQSERMVTSAQANLLRQVETLVQSNVEDLTEPLGSIEAQAKSQLPADQQNAVLAFIATVRYSDIFWYRYANDLKPYTAGSKQSFPQFSLQVSCRECIRNNRRAILLADGLGALLAWLTCTATSGGTAIGPCVAGGAVVGAVFSAGIICQRCPMCPVSCN